MTRPLDTRLDRVEGRRTASAVEHASATRRDRRLWRAKAATGAVIRGALTRAGVDPANAPRLCLADEAAAALAALPDTPELQREDSNGTPPAVNPSEEAPADAFTRKILAMAQQFAGGEPFDPARASFAELFAWSLARRRRE